MDDETGIDIPSLVGPVQIVAGESPGVAGIETIGKPEVTGITIITRSFMVEPLEPSINCEDLDMYCWLGLPMLLQQPQLSGKSRVF